jgi:hypothetical protein
VVVVVAAGGYLLVRARHEDLRPTRQYLTGAAALVGGAAATSLTWLVVRTAISLPGASPREEAERVSVLRPAQVLENVARFVTPWDREPSSLYPLAVITSYLFVGSLLVALATLRRGDRRYPLAMVVGVVLLAGPLLLVATNFLVRGTYTIVEPRYGSTLVPIQCAISASFWSGRALIAVGALAVVAPVAVLLRLLF